MDANVIGYTGASPLDPKMFKASEILCRILRNPHKLVLDCKRGNDETILDEYQRQIKTSQLAQKWLIAMQQTKDKIEYRYRAYTIHINGLSDPDDEKYFQLAIKSPNKIIISEDSDLTDIAEDPQVIQLGIQIWGFDICLNKI